MQMKLWCIPFNLIISFINCILQQCKMIIDPGTLALID